MNNEELVSKLVPWIRGIVKDAGGGGCVLGLSGGIDSSVLAVLCQRAFPENILGLIMPCYSNEEDEGYARLVTAKFNIPTEKVNLGPAYDALLKICLADKSDNRLAIANVKPRLRMTTLYYFANKLGYLVAGTGDRSEITVGYFTKYGDGGTDFLPLGNLLKTQVRELGRYLGVPEAIVAKPSSPGLWAGQTGEGEMGITYEAIDRYVLTGKAAAGVKEKIEAMIRRSEHKRRLPPVPEFRLTDP